MPASTLYLDHLSTTPLALEVRLAMEQYRAHACATASSSHASGVRAREALREARASFQKMMQAASAEEILFTSGGTESANLAIKGVAWASASSGKKHLVLSQIEHPAVEESVRFLEKQGFHATRVAVEQDGRIYPDSIRDAIREDTCLVAIHQANHDLGTVQPVAEIAGICRQQSVPLFCDASSSGAWLPLKVQDLGADLVSLSPHRFYGPRGVGILYHRGNLTLESLIHGGRQEFQLRAGTENMEAIVGAGVAARLASNESSRREIRCRQLQSFFLERLAAGLTHWNLNGAQPGPGRDPHHLSISFQHVEAEALALRLDLRGMEVGALTGCRTRDLKLSPVLKALGVPKEWALGTILIGLSESLQEADMERACDEIISAVGKLREMSAGWKSRGLTTEVTENTEPRFFNH
jgi:cysteine desulfurase